MVAAVAGAVLGAIAGEDPWDLAFGAGLIGVIVMAVVSDGRRVPKEPRASVFLREMASNGVIDPDTYERLMAQLVARGVEVAAPPPPPPAGDMVPSVVSVPTAPVGPPMRPAPIRSSTPISAGAAAPERRGRPSPPAWLAPAGRFWHSLVTDFAVQGLGSLGVLLVFTGTLGFVIFAFTEVGAGLRPLAEILLPAVLAGLAAFLYRRDATFVAASLEFLFGLLTPVMAFAAFADGVAFPPDLERGALVATLSFISLVLAAGYAALARRRPSSPLRFLVAPLVWVTAGVLGLAFEEGVSAAQMAGVTFSVAGSAWLVQRLTGSIAAATARVAVPGLLLAYTLTLATAWTEGWPVVPLLVALVAVVAGVESMAGRIPMPWLAQAAAVILAAAPLATSLDSGWVAAGGALVMLALAERWAPTPAPDAAIALLMSAAGAGALLAFEEPGALLMAATLLSIWAGFRRRTPLRASLTGASIAIAAIAPAGIVVALEGLLGLDTALLLSAALAAGGAMVIRRWAAGDVFYALWVPTLAAGLATATLLALPAPADHRPSVTLLLAALAVVAGRLLPVGLRTWVAVSFTTLAAAISAAVEGVPYEVRITVLAATGIALIAVGAAVRERIGGHLAATGHSLGAVALGALMVALGLDRLTGGWLGEEAWLAVTSGAWAAGWLVEVATGQTSSPLQRLAKTEATRRTIDVGQTTVLIMSLPVTAVASAASIWDNAATAAAIGSLAALAPAYAALSLVAGLRPDLRRWLANGAMAVSAAATTLLLAWFDPDASVDRWVAIVVLGAATSASAAASLQLRHALVRWYGWAASAPFTVVVARQIGVTWAASHWTLFAWGLTVAAFALVLDDRRNGRRSPGTLTAEPWLAPPATLGMAAVVGATLVGLNVPLAAMWPGATAAAGAGLLLALILRLGLVSTASWGFGILAMASGVVAVGHDLADQPWPLAVAATITLIAGLALSPDGAPMARWDIPALVAGTGAAIVSVTLGGLAGATSTTWVPVGLASLAVGAHRRQPVPLALGYGLLVAAAYLAGAEWLAGTLAAGSAAAAVSAWYVPTWRQPLLWTSATAAMAAWLATLEALSATPQLTIGALLGASAVVAVTAAVAVAMRRDVAWAVEWLVPWAGVAALTLGAATVASVVSPSEGVLWIQAGSLALWATSLAVSGSILDRDGLRVSATFAGLASVGSTGLALDLDTSEWVALLCVAAVVATVVAVGVWYRQRSTRGWVVVLGGAAITAQALALVQAADLLPSRAALAVVFLVAAAQSLAAGLVMRDVRLMQLSSPLLFASWATIATQALNGDIQWITSPLGVAVLAVVELGRWDRARRGLEASTDNLRISEVAGMAIFVGPALFQTLVVATGYGLIAILQGVALVVWGTGSRVRRRVYGGAAAAALGAAFMILVPLISIVPEIRGPALWATILGLGAVLLTIAATIEQMRRGVAGVRRSLHGLMEGWE